ncbi:MAG: glycosyltransferase family 2 protein [Planctomycetota bacterium]
MSLQAEPRRDICVIIPCYNEAPAIGRIIRTAQVYVEQVIVVDDGSTDGTSAEAESSGALVIHHARNMGKGVALKTGFQIAAQRGLAAAITLDGDGQHACAEIPLFIKAYDQGDCDLVLGNRMNDTSNMPCIRRITNRFTSWAISRTVGQTIADTQCGFRLISLAFWQAVRLDSCRFDLESEILIKAGRSGVRLRQVQIQTIYFSVRNSNIKPLRDTLRFIHLLWRCNCQVDKR